MIVGKHLGNRNSRKDTNEPFSSIFIHVSGQVFDLRKTWQLETLMFPS